MHHELFGKIDLRMLFVVLICLPLHPTGVLAYQKKKNSVADIADFSISARFK
jgi:hypothetical protein